MDTVFRTQIPDDPTARDVERAGEPGIGTETHIEGEPVEDMKLAVLESLDLGDDPNTLDGEITDTLSDIGAYVKEVLKTKGISPTRESFKEALLDIKYDMGLDERSDPEVTLDRIGGVIKAWRELSFIKDPREKRSLFMKLARCEDSRSMNKLVLEVMNQKEVWL
jgi:hypothetical protein